MPLELLELRLKETRTLYPKVEGRMRLRAHLLQQSIKKGNAPAEVQQDYMHREKHTQWRCCVRVSASEVKVHALRWWMHGPKEHRDQALDAIMLRGHEMPLHFDSHFWSRWGLRSELMGVLLTNMMGFYKQYPYLKLYQTKRFYPAQPQFATALPQGLVFGRQNGKRLVSCDTLKHHEIMSANERVLWEKLARKAGLVLPKVA